MLSTVALVILAAALVALVLRARAIQRKPKRSPKHQDKVVMLDKMLHNEAIVLAGLATGVFTKDGLRRLAVDIWEVDEAQLDVYLYRMYAKRVVRKAIAKYWRDQHGWNERGSQDDMRAFAKKMGVVEEEFVEPARAKARRH